MEPISAIAATVSVIGNLLGFRARQRAARQAEIEGRSMAQDAERRGQFEAEQYMRFLSQTIGTQRTAIAGQGVDVDFGTAAAIQQETRDIGMADVRMIRANALREAYALRHNYQNQAAALRGSSMEQLGGALGTGLQLGARAWDRFGKPNARLSANASPAFGL